MTTIDEQPLDFSRLGQKYRDFAVDFIEDHADDPFFLYVPFTHVHTTAANIKERQYAGCPFQGSCKRGKFGDALAEVDWIISEVINTLESLNLDHNTLVLFTSDNGPWMAQTSSGGSVGIFSGSSAGYINTGKGSTWEGGLREPAFAYWPGKIKPGTRSSEIVSSLDVLPTIAKLAGVPLKKNRVYDGRDMNDILFKHQGKSKHKFLFFYDSNRSLSQKKPSSCRWGSYKAHWWTASGLTGGHENPTFYPNPPLLFNVDVDPSEAYPLTVNNTQPKDDYIKIIVQQFQDAYAEEVRTFNFNNPPPEPDQPYEAGDKYGLCCDRTKDCYCVP